MKLLWSVVLLLLCRNYVESAKILGIFTVPSKSHSILGFELFKELVKSGHEVTVITPKDNELKNPPKNYTNIIVGGEPMESLFREYMDKAFDEVDVSPFLQFKDMINNTVAMTEFFCTHPKVQELLNSDSKFDLVISELALNDALLGFSEHYKCPHILISTVGITPWVTTVTSNPSSYSYNPHPFLDMTDRMSFSERLRNTLFHVSEDILLKSFFYPKQKEIYETAFPTSKSFRPFWDKMKHGVSLVLLNMHYSLSFPRAYFPNLIEVGGMHIKKKTNPLPNDIKKFIDESEHGVVYFSLGGNLNPSVMPLEKQEAIINALSKLKERILWKWDDLNAKVDRKKFLIKNWFPQDDVLADPRVKVFITHGGLLGGTEAIYYGIPLVTIPIFGDQKLNAAKSTSLGYGVRVDYSNLTESSLSWGLNEVINNKKYSERVKELSNRFRDKPQHPLDLAKFYVEYVIRHNGAPFLQASPSYMSFIEANNLDVWCLIIFSFVVTVAVPLLLIKKVIQLIRGTRKEKVSVSKKKTKTH